MNSHKIDWNVYKQFRRLPGMEKQCWKYDKKERTYFKYSEWQDITALLGFLENKNLRFSPPRWDPNGIEGLPMLILPDKMKWKADPGIEYKVENGKLWRRQKHFCGLHMQ